MKLLLENWRRFLNEGMKTVDDLPEGTKIRITDIHAKYGSDSGGKRAFQIKLVNKTHDENSEDMDWFMTMRARNPSKSREHGPEGDINLIELDKCAGGNVFEIHSSADPDWGPLLYDIAIEFATLIGNGATSAREEATKASPEALAVWDYYLANRRDVLNVQTDTHNNLLTPTPDDNCSQPYDLPPDKDDRFALDKDEFLASSRTKVYTKEPTTLQALKQGGLLVGNVK